ncbi:hypothetical protein [Terrabacter terrigena]|uniref:Uncharacterized protein n=1 Tax=Terrabacter terrigena TaxID=574718 RepID=A0ABW3N048_9MICO
MTALHDDEEELPEPTHTLLAWWPINDQTATYTRVMREATEDLEQVAARAHARVIGRPVFRYEPGTAIAGAAAYGVVLVARAPAVRVDNLAAARAAAAVISTTHSTQKAAS